MPISQNDYLEIQGNLTHCWKVHKRVMQNKGEPRVTYSSFRHRVRIQGWNLYKAIHTPAIVKKRDKDRRRKVRWYKVKKFFRELFNLGC